MFPCLTLFSSSCVFDREVERTVEDPTSRVVAIGSVEVYKRTNTYKVTDYYWNYTCNYELFAFRGNEPNKRFTFQSRTCNYQILTSSKNNPQAHSSFPAQDVLITWIFQNLKNTSLNFKIDRTNPECRTPRRNPEIAKALQFFNDFSQWCDAFNIFFQAKIFPIQKDHGLDLEKINSEQTFIPVLPLFEKQKGKKPSSPRSPRESKKEIVSSGGSNSVMLSMNDCGAFLQDQRKTLDTKLADIRKMFPVAEKAKLISVVEACMLVVSFHAQALVSSYIDSVNYIEHMLYAQLCAALGKVVQPQDFTEYMLFHNKKIFKPAYQPKPFCFAVRRPEHSPEGVISIDIGDGKGESPIYTIVSQSNPVRPMKFPISSSTSITYTGERYLHGWMDHQFKGSGGTSSLTMTARTRQFSCFVVVIGTVVTLDHFEPTNAFLLQNQDELRIPLALETLPTPKVNNPRVLPRVLIQFRSFKMQLFHFPPNNNDLLKQFVQCNLQVLFLALQSFKSNPHLKKSLNFQMIVLQRKYVLHKTYLSYSLNIKSQVIFYHLVVILHFLQVNKKLILYERMLRGCFL